MQENKKIRDVYLHHIGCFPKTLILRKETIEETISLLKIDDIYDSNINYFDRTNHLYRNSYDTLHPLLEIVQSSEQFIEAKILHKSSYLGLPYHLIAKHKSGHEIIYDGLAYSVSECVHNDDCSLDQLHDFTHYPHRIDNIIKDFGNILRQLITDLPETQYTMYSFYSAYVSDWNIFGLKREGEAQLCLQLNDKKIMTVTGLTHSKIGKEYNVYIGERNTILEMNSHHMFYILEYSNFADHIDNIRNRIDVASGAISQTMTDITKSLPMFVDKYTSWNVSKASIREMYSIKKLIKNYEIMSETLQEISKERWASRNSPRQLFLDGECDDEWKTSYWCQNFFEAKLENGKVTDLKDAPMVPLYSTEIDNILHKVDLLKLELQSILTEARDLLSAIQTEFSMYAVWLAFGAVVVSVIVTGISIAAG
ncbi:hypothetical protein GBN24_06765 [Plesiomonas shigelloides]|uniref:hypothetical protein n=1 Tax=Plesiomonas shigelloides TaxID=703 RepID=UPI0012621F38|nr:hypothetical protein [Plesiomonas shigelloides]KAB7691794.1 hypothetical protein GBN24_06765 [Plesiomonas shigelloides]